MTTCKYTKPVDNKETVENTQIRDDTQIDYYDHDISAYIGCDVDHPFGDTQYTGLSQNQPPLIGCGARNNHGTLLMKMCAQIDIASKKPLDNKYGQVYIAALISANANLRLKTSKEYGFDLGHCLL